MPTNKPRTNENTIVTPNCLKIHKTHLCDESISDDDCVVDCTYLSDESISKQDECCSKFERLKRSTSRRQRPKSQKGEENKKQALMKKKKRNETK